MSALDNRIQSISSLSRKWLDRNFVYRKLAVRRLTKRSGFSASMAEAMLDALFKEWTAGRMKTLIRSEIKYPQALERVTKDVDRGVMLRLFPPGMILHVFASNIPVAAVHSVLLGLMIGSKNVAKLSRKDEGFLEIYLESLRAHDKSLAQNCEVLPKKDQIRKVREWAVKADLVVAYGSDESLSEIRNLLPGKTPFVGYGHRMSASFIMIGALKKKNILSLAKVAAKDIWMADQRGCLSPLQLYVQKGGEVGPLDFCGALAKELEKLNQYEIPFSPGRLAHRRHMKERTMTTILRGGLSYIWESKVRGAWMMTYDEQVNELTFSGAQCVSVKGFNRLSDLIPSLQHYHRHLQAASLACAPGERLALSSQLIQIGFHRVCQLGLMQEPPLWWCHDGLKNVSNWLVYKDL